MSAIGEYIHLTAKGYNESGTNRPHAAAGISPTQAAAAQRQKITEQMKTYSKVGKNTTKKIEKEMNELITTLGTDSNQEISDDETKLQEYLVNQIGQEIAQLSNINFNNLSTTYTPAPVSKLANNFYKSKGWKDRLTTKVNEFNNALKQLEYLQQAKGGTNSTQVEQLIKKLDKLINETYEKTYQHLTEAGYYTGARSKTVRNMINKLNVLIKEYNSIPIVDNTDNRLLKGIVQQIPNVSEYVAINALKEGLDTKSKNITITTQNPQQTNINTTIDLGELQEVINSNKESIEIQFKWKSRTYQAKVNNIKLRSGFYQFINVDSTSSLYDVLADGDTEFTNHYYNIFTQHQDGQINVVGMRSEYNSILKLMAIYRAFDKIKEKDKIFIFTETDGKNSKARVVSIHDILDNVINGNDKLTSVMTGNESIPQANLLSNKKVPNNITGNTRIGKVLADARARKLRAGLSSSVLSNIK